ncbi:two-component sensor histidine kinase [Treponema parvum]|uniref:histidine kinase n=1 Tax=Treponema parvum TaxID=138851 RepID=A0A975F3V7_9SPIR|nr:ATP-binding protein [Treponema parvum]QTQ13892.1 two-component sensor histidine kinase [Treponema parvum]
MHGFVKRVSQKVSKLSPVQIEQLFNSVSDENETLNSVFESIPIGILVVNKSFIVQKANKAVGRYIPFKIHPEDPKAENTPLWNLIDDAEIASFIETCYKQDKTNLCSEFTVTTSGGSARFITLTLIPLVRRYNSAGTIISVADNTEKRNQDVLLRRMESLASLTNLAASVAHEIKNPLGAIGIHIQLIQKALKKAREGGGLLPDKKFIENYLNVINEEIDNLNKIVVDFLFAVRPISANLELSDPNALIERLSELFKPEFAQNNIETDIELCDASPRLLIDEKLFHQVISNIVQNSIAAIKERSLGDESFKGRFSIVSRTDNDRYVLILSDNGIGMSEKTLSHIFEPYYTTKPNGTGLGMTMVYKIVKEFSGEIDVTSARGKGSVFTISLPIPQTGMRLLPHDEEIKNPPAVKIEDEI